MQTHMQGLPVIIMWPLTWTLHLILAIGTGHKSSCLEESNWNQCKEVVRWGGSCVCIRHDLMLRGCLMADGSHLARHGGEL